MRSHILWFYLSFSILDVTSASGSLPRSWEFRLPFLYKFIAWSEGRVGCIFGHGSTNRTCSRRHCSIAPRVPGVLTFAASPQFSFDPQMSFCASRQSFFLLSARSVSQAAVALPGPSPVTVLCSKSRGPTFALFSQ